MSPKAKKTAPVEDLKEDLFEEFEDVFEDTEEEGPTDTETSDTEEVSDDTSEDETTSGGAPEPAPTPTETAPKAKRKKTPQTYSLCEAFSTTTEESKALTAVKAALAEGRTVLVTLSFTDDSKTPNRASMMKKVEKDVRGDKSSLAGKRLTVAAFPEPKTPKSITKTETVRTVDWE